MDPQSESEEVEWEDVEEPTHDIAVQETDLQIIVRKGAKRIGISKQERLNRELVHKAHLLCLIMSCFLRNSWIDDPEVGAIVWSFLPKNFSFHPVTIKSVKNLIEVFKNTFSFNADIEHGFESLNDLKFLASRESSTYWSAELFSIYFASLCRAANISSRLICALNPISLSFAKSRKPVDNCPCLRFLTELNIRGEWKIVDPFTGTLADAILDENQLFSFPVSYVIAFETGIGAKDVTRRYTSKWAQSTIKRRLPPTDENQNWFDITLWLLSKSTVQRDDILDDSRLLEAEKREKMPTSYKGFQNHPLYALERFCKKHEVIYPCGKKDAIGVFRGELVFPRQNLRKLESERNWRLGGKMIKSGETPLKSIKNPKDGAEITDLYAAWQTAEFIRPNMINNVIPKNSYGNIEIFAENMIPQGAVHILGKYCLIQMIGLAWSPKSWGLTLPKP
jgi:hypothetical protein